MQDAYVVDQQTKGDFEAIGYEKPTSSVFTYGQGTTAGTDDWYADANGKLDKCNTSDKWTMGVNVTGGKASYTPNDDCSALTPNFKYIGSSKS